MFRRLMPKWDDNRIYVLNVSEQDRRRIARTNLCFTLAAAAVQVLMGMVNQPSSRTAWVVYPYLIMFLPVMYACMGAVTFLRSTCRMSAAQYYEGPGRVRRSLLAVFILNTGGIVLECLYLFLNRGQTEWTPELLYIGLHLAQAAVILGYSRFYDRNLAGVTVEQ